MKILLISLATWVILATWSLLKVSSRASREEENREKNE